MTAPDGYQSELRALFCRKAVCYALKQAGIQIGVATLPGGGTAPACNVGRWQEGTTVKGLEILIAPNPKVKTPEAFEFLGFLRTWQVRFINNEGKPDILERAANALAQVVFPFDDDPVRLEATATMKEQFTIGINIDQLPDALVAEIQDFTP